MDPNKGKEFNKRPNNYYDPNSNKFNPDNKSKIPMSYYFPDGKQKPQGHYDTGNTNMNKYNQGYHQQQEQHFMMGGVGQQQQVNPYEIYGEEFYEVITIFNK
jgi:hypothetical protein